LPAPQPAPTLLPDLDTLERLVRYETCLARELSRALRELRQLQAADRTSEFETNPIVTSPAAAAAPPAALAATVSIPLPRPFAQTNPTAPIPGNDIAETNPPAVQTQPAAAAAVAARPASGCPAQPEALQVAAAVAAAMTPRRQAIPAQPEARMVRRNARKLTGKRRR